MHSHPLNRNIMVLNRLDEVKPVCREDSQMWLTDEFQKNNYHGAIIKTPELDAIAASFNYESDGFSQILRGGGFLERGPIARYRNRMLGKIWQANYYHPHKDPRITDLDPDLKIYEESWRNLFSRFGEEVSPCFGNNFGIRMKRQWFEEEYNHRDKDIILILPLGENRDSTIFKFGRKRYIKPEPGSATITTPIQKHTSPVSEIPRACIAAVRFEHLVP